MEQLFTFDSNLAIKLYLITKEIYVLKLLMGFFAVYLLPILLFLLFIMVLKKNWLFLITSVFGIGVLYLIAQLISSVTNRLRPYQEWPEYISPLIERFPADQSFPSGHALIAFACITFLWLYFKKSLESRLLFFAAAFVALGRIGVGVHYFSDVVVGALLGYFGALGWSWLADKIGVKVNKKINI